MLREFDILKNLTDTELENLSRSASIKRFDKNSTIYEYGENPNYVYLIQKGSIKLGIHATCGKVLIKDIVYDQAVFGENVFLEDSRRKEFAKAMTETSVIMIPIDPFKTTILNNVKFASDIMHVIILRMQLLDERMQSFVFKKAKTRIIDFIKRTSELRGIRIGLNEILINHGMSHKEIAYLTDTSRQTVARILGELKKDDFIHFSARKPNKILVRETLSLA